MDTAPRKETSKFGSSLVAISLAEYMDAPASDVTTHPRKQEFLESFSSSSSSTIMFKFEFATSVSVSLDAVPSPIAITETLYSSHTFLIFFFISISLCK